MDYQKQNYQYRLAQRKRQNRRRLFLGGGASIILLIAICVCTWAIVHPSKVDNVPSSSNQEFTNLQAGGKKESGSVSDSIVMTIYGDRNTRVLKGEEYLEAGCHATDTQNRENISDIAISGNVDTGRAGTYEIKYSATSKDGRQNYATRTVTVEDDFEHTNYVPVCMYHYVYDDSNKPETVDNNWMHASTFEEELKYLSENDYYYPSFEELASFVEGKHSLPDKSVILTFDDAMPQFLMTGVPLLDKYKIPATSFVICNDEDARDKIMNYASQFVQYQSHSYAMHRGGSGIGRGGVIHSSSREDIIADQKKASDILGTNVAYAYPFGDNDETAQSALQEAGVKCAFTIDNKQVKVGDNLYALPRVRINGSFNLQTFVSQIS